MVQDRSVTVILGGLTVESHVLCSCCCDCLCPHLTTVTCRESARSQVRNISSSIITVTRFQLHIHITSTTQTLRLNLSRNFTLYKDKETVLTSKSLSF